MSLRHRIEVLGAADTVTGEATSTPRGRLLAVGMVALMVVVGGCSGDTSGTSASSEREAKLQAACENEAYALSLAWDPGNKIPRVARAEIMAFARAAQGTVLQDEAEYLVEMSRYEAGGLLPPGSGDEMRSEMGSIRRVCSRFVDLHEW